MKSFLSILAGLFFLAGCATTIERIVMPPLERIDPDLMFYQTGKSRPEWVRKSWWQEGDKLYVVGKATRQVKNADLRRRIAELEAVEKILRIKNTCHARIFGKHIVETWQERNGTIFVLVEVSADGIISLNDCMPRR